MNIFTKTWNGIKGLVSTLIAPADDNKPEGKPPVNPLRRPNKTDEIISSINNLIKKRVDLIDRQIKDLTEKQKLTQANISHISKIDEPDLSAINSSIEKLNQYVKEKPKPKPPHHFALYKPKQEFEDLLKINNLLKQFQDREIARKRKEELYKKEIQATLDKIADLINQDKLEEAKYEISQIQNKIKASLTHEIKRLEKLKQKLEDWELEIIKKQQEEEQRKRDEEAKQLKEEEERREKAEREKREREEQERLAREEKAKQAREKLEKLLEKKPNWQEFQQVLQQNGITTLYHFADRANIRSIKEHGGLFSWHYCEKNRIAIPRTGGDTLSRQLDKRYDLHDFVRLSFCNDHPMQWRLKQNDYDLVLLKVKIDVAYFCETHFSDINAADSGHSNGTELQHLKQVNFKATQRNYVRNDDPDFKQHQAEVLVKTWIPIEYITNINNY
ncbi:MAG: DarT ssDNA thymidine ADP-ribosyltransferase family protein [Prevotella sp.]|jgi:chemotaxis protein histidine kinase CheA|nr:DarT ssDNA thymidine ADP-ribosyltransferase family protein [Prevotella sp.]